MPSKYWRRQVRKVTVHPEENATTYPRRRSDPQLFLRLLFVSTRCLFRAIHTYPLATLWHMLTSLLSLRALNPANSKQLFRFLRNRLCRLSLIGIIGTMNPKLRDPWKPVTQSPCREPWSGAWDDSAFCVEELTKKAAWCISGPGPHGSHRRWCWQRTNIETLRSIWIFPKGFNELLNPFLINLNKSTWMRCW